MSSDTFRPDIASITEAADEGSILQALKLGRRFSALLDDLPIQMTFRLAIEAAGLKPRKGAKKETFVLAHRKELLQAFGTNKKVQVDLVSNWLSEAIGEDPFTFLCRNDAPDTVPTWKTALVCLLKARLIGTAPQSPTSERLLADIASGEEERLSSGTLGEFERWYYRALLESHMDVLQEEVRDHTVDLVAELQGIRGEGLDQDVQGCTADAQEAVRVAIDLASRFRGLVEDLEADLRERLDGAFRIARAAGCDTGWKTVGDDLEDAVPEGDDLLAREQSSLDWKTVRPHLQTIAEWLSVSNEPEVDAAGILSEFGELLTPHMSEDDRTKLEEPLRAAMAAANSEKPLKPSGPLAVLLEVCASDDWQASSSWEDAGRTFSYKFVTALSSELSPDAKAAARSLSNRLSALTGEVADSSENSREYEGAGEVLPDEQDSPTSTDSRSLLPAEGDGAGEGTEALEESEPGTLSTDRREEQEDRSSGKGHSSEPAAVETLAAAEGDPRLELKVREFPTGRTRARSFALRFLDGEPPNQDTVAELVWSLAAEGRPVLSQLLATELVAEHDLTSAGYLPHLLEVILLGQHVWSASGPAARLQRDALKSLQEHSDVFGDGSETATDLKVALFAGLLQPTLLAQGCEASGWLSSLSFGERIPALHEMKSAVLEFTRLGLELSPALLKGVRELAVREKELAAFRRGAADWLEKNRDKSIRNGLSFRPAAQAWRYCLQPDQELGQALEAAVASDEGMLKKLPDINKTWSDQGNVQARLQRIHQQQRPGQGAIVGPSVQRFFHLSQEALDLLNRWGDLARSQPGNLNQDGYSTEKAAACREALLSAREQVDDQLRAYAESASTALQKASADSLAACMEAIGVLLDPSRPNQPPIEPDPRTIRNELLSTEGLNLDENLQLVRIGEDFATARLVAAAAAEPLSLEEAFEAHLKRHDHSATDQIVELLSRRGTALEIEDLKRRRKSDLQDCQEKARERLVAIQIEIEKGVEEATLDEETRLQMSARLQAIDPKEVLNFNVMEAELELFQQKIGERKARKATEIRRQLDAKRAEIEARTQQRIEAAIEEGNLLAASEYLDSPEMTDIDTFEPFGRTLEQFFPRFSAQAEKVTTPRRSIANQVGQQRNVGPIDMSEVPGAQAKSAERMLLAWLKLKDGVGSKTEAFQELLTEVGFDAVEVGTLRKLKNMASTKLSTASISDRDTCPIPFFGSQAMGRYSLVCAWERPPEDRLLRFALDSAEGLPVIVLYFGQLTTARRRGLAKWCRRRRACLVVIDETLLYFLCSQRGDRLPIMFMSTLPFTTSNPYTTTAGIVPPEMFFGRGAEMESIMDPLGTNLVYGGRQLGKTAMLREVARSNHRPLDEIIVKWLDLKVEGVGTLRPIDEIRQVVLDALQKEGIVSASATVNTLKDNLLKWFDGAPTRRLVLLLDEADMFLDNDKRNKKQPFLEVDYLKGLMDATNRRFKIVFAGLHDVQRISREVNSPLAHLGAPICVGPLLDNGEWRQARALIVEPMSAMGFEFESRDLPVRILSYTNYYPSLIQLFCKELLTQLSDTNRSRFDGNSVPPYIIKLVHIENAYRSAQLRRDIRDRFEWTLNLDPRYRFLALRIAVGCHHQESGLVEGFSVRWLRDEALGLWPEAFEGRNMLEDLRTMLDEMIGLGVLRTQGTRYTIRSSNLLNLLGTEQRLEEKLFDSKYSELPAAPEPAFFRRHMGQDHWHLSPLTADQESQILLSRRNGTAVLFGSPASGLDNCIPALEKAAAPVQLRIAESIARSGFEEELRSALENSSDGLNLIVVPAATAWTHEWVTTACKLVARRSARSTVHRVVFIGDFTHAWKWSGLLPDQLEPWEGEDLVVTGLRPWTVESLKRWCLDVFPVGVDVERIQTLTGLWAKPLLNLAEVCRTDPDRWSEALQEMESLGFSDSAATEFGVSGSRLTALKTLAEYEDPLDPKGLADLCDEATAATAGDLARALHWGELLHYTTPEGGGRFSLDPNLAKRLQGLPQSSS